MAKSKAIHVQDQHDQRRSLDNRNSFTSMDDLVPMRSKPSVLNSKIKVVENANETSSLPSPSSPHRTTFQQKDFSKVSLSPQNIYTHVKQETADFEEAKSLTSPTASQHSLSAANNLNASQGHWSSTNSINSSQSVGTYSSLTAVNTGQPSNNLSSDNPPAKLRTRDKSAIGGVKFTPATSRFEDLRSEATKSWDEGVDIELESGSKNKSTKNWMSENQFLNSAPDSTATTSNHQSSQAKQSKAGWNDQWNSEPSVKPSVTTQKQTYSDIVNRNTPDWAANDYSTNNSGGLEPHVDYPFAAPQSWLSNVMPVPNPHPMGPMFIPYMHMPNMPNNYPAVAPPNLLRDTEHLQYFCIVIRDRGIHGTVAKFQKNSKSFFSNIHEMSFRTFSLFLECLIIALESDAISGQNETVHQLRQNWLSFAFLFSRFLSVYAKLPQDVLVVAHFASVLSRHSYPEMKNLPIQEIFRVYQSIEELCSLETKAELKHLIKHLQTLTNQGDTHWGDQGDPLPSIPTANDIVYEVIQNVNVLLDYETKKETRLVNRVHNPWPKVDLLNYTLTHFMMLRDELVGPVRAVIQELFSGRDIAKVTRENGSAVFSSTKPKSVSLLASTSEPGFVFELGTFCAKDSLMESFEEGSFVVLLPEDYISVHSADRDAAFINIAKGAMLGQAIRASSNRNNKALRVVSIHIQKNDIYKLDWNATYTMITTRCNVSSTLSVLEWLHKEYKGLKKEQFSTVLTPRILAAKNILSDSELTAWDKERYEQSSVINQDSIPDYVADADIDVSCIMIKNGFRAKPGEGNWPSHSEQMEQVPIHKRPPLYNLSTSQVEAVKFAMTHRIAVISGAPGTGKTHLASKLAQLLVNCLSAGQFHQPVLIITKSQSSLDTILSSLIHSIPDIARFGCEAWDDLLTPRQATRLANINASDNNYREHQNLERQILKNQAKLNALCQTRQYIKDHDPSFLSTTIPPMYLTALQNGYAEEQYSNNNYLPNNHVLWQAWACDDKRTKDFSAAQVSQKAFENAQWTLEKSYLKKLGRGIMPITEPNVIQSRFNWVAINSVKVHSIKDSLQWPFESSACSGDTVRNDLLNVWKLIPAHQIWTISSEEKTRLIKSLVMVLLRHIDQEISNVLQDQTQTAQAYDENITSKWSYLCRFNRVIGMPAAFAAAHRSWVSTLWPRAVIVDEASEILESTVASAIFGRRTEHVVLLGDGDHLSKPSITNPDLAGDPRNLNVSLFERWKRSGSDVVRLEEQWRMHSEVADITDQFNSIKDLNSSLLITSPHASFHDNMVNGKRVSFEKLYGITQRAFYLDYQNKTSSAAKDLVYSRILMTDVTQAEVDEARFVAFFAVYLSQQPYPSTKIAILTVTLLQKYLIRQIIREEVPRRTCFKGNSEKINIDTIDQYTGRQTAFTIISTATPAHTFSDNSIDVSRALTRASYGLFVIGKPTDKIPTRWSLFANYMKERKLFGPSLQLSCHEHGDTFTVSGHQDFEQMRNGGCNRPCGMLMSDGHVCPEVCHFISHEPIVCKEPCNRIRPSHCTHTCTQLCFKCSKDGSCPPCQEQSDIQLSCGHSFNGVCSSLQKMTADDCQATFNVRLDCGHEKQVVCSLSKKKSNMKCDVVMEVKMACGHVAATKCGIEPVCIEPCGQTFECQHKCVEICGIEHSHERKDCPAHCPKQLICGHGCAKGCSNPDEHTERCMEKCNYICSHGYKCSRECWKDCIKCVSLCPYKCNHFKCTKKCYEICDRPPCEAACRVKLECSHECAGLCGEPCPPCIICSGDLVCSISLRKISEFDYTEKVYMLPECGCVFAADSLDQFFQHHAKNGEHTAIKLWSCPTCQETIYTALRYNKYIKTEIGLVNTIKLRLEKERRRLTHVEKEQIIHAMNKELQPDLHNIVGGRWFVCPNQHPYYIGDCGGATEVSTCPECNAPIGGLQHKVVDSNRFYGEFDGSTVPAWPGQPAPTLE